MKRRIIKHANQIVDFIFILICAIVLIFDIMIYFCAKSLHVLDSIQPGLIIYFLVKDLILLLLFFVLKIVVINIIMTVNYIDKKTNLFLKQKLENDLYWYQKNKKHCYIMSIDFNGLKKINDECGHIIGDEVLLLFAQELKRIVNEDKKTSLYRLYISGDEFVIVSFDIACIKRYEKELENMYNKEIILDGKCKKIQVHLNCSYGYSFFDPNQNRSIMVALSESDALMYQNKKMKKNKL